MPQADKKAGKVAIFLNTHTHTDECVGAFSIWAHLYAFVFN